MRSPLLRAIPLAAALALALSAPAAWAGVLMKFEHRPAGAEKATPGSAWIEADRLRMEADGSTVIFRADKGLLWTWNADKKEYIELTRAEADAMGGMMAEMQKELAKLSPEERAMAEQMMGARMGAASSRYGGSANAPDPLKVTALGKNETIHGWACSAHEVRRGTTLEGTYWVTDWKQFNLAASDFKVLGDLTEFLHALTGPMSGSVQNPFAQRYGADGIPGVPVRVVAPDTSTNDITTLERQEMAATLFELPAGMKKQDLGMPGKR